MAFAVALQLILPVSHTGYGPDVTRQTCYLHPFCYVFVCLFNACMHACVCVGLFVETAFLTGQEAGLKCLTTQSPPPVTSFLLQSHTS